MTTPLTAAVLLDIAEREARSHPRRQAILMLSAHSGEDPAALLALPLGDLDARLAELRQSLFGSRCDGRTACPSCGEAVEFEFAVSDVFRPVPVREEHSFNAGNAVVRLPTSAHLLDAAAHARGEAEARTRLLATVTDPPLHDADSEAEQVGQAIAQHDPNSDIQLALSCPSCASQWNAVFDIACWLVTEVRSWSRRVLREVHELARSYGWSEAEILAMSATRRRSYLSLAGLA